MHCDKIQFNNGKDLPLCGKCNNTEKEVINFSNDKGKGAVNCWTSVFQKLLNQIDGDYTTKQNKSTSQIVQGDGNRHTQKTEMDTQCLQNIGKLKYEKWNNYCAFKIPHAQTLLYS